MDMHIGMPQLENVIGAFGTRPPPPYLFFKKGDVRADVAAERLQVAGILSQPQPNPSPQNNAIVKTMRLLKQCDC